ncbi:PREDICTED: uncharacterized protein LOC109210052 [Nicotiana attenuata]|uniref:uncharacterized protein LOC109210052 n=1 Tax=Nicotiana attenuata TaxID=49451 RepID=UPI000904BAF2|nr:PREDICTED: uncharacterized protein LOC109210052 [Nicotiana attenuata]
MAKKCRLPLNEEGLSLKEEWKAKSEQAKANRVSKKGGSLHTGGSITFEAHKLKMEKERGRDMTYAEVFEELHKKKKKDGTREHWVETRASDTYEDYHKRLEEWQQTQPPSTQSTPDDMASLWTEAAGGANKGRVYGLGVHRPTGHPNPLLDNSSPQNQEQMEDMKNEIRGLKQQLDSQNGMFVKMQKFRRKHGHDLSDDEDEQTESDL